MKNIAGLCAISCLLIGGRAMVAQESSAGVLPAPKVLVIEREWLKPGRSGAMHEKSEGAFIAAAKAAKWQTHYVAAASMSGRPRVLFMFGFPSFEAWEKDNRATESNPVFAAAIDKATVADGELQTEYNQSVFTLDSENSLRLNDAVHAHYFEISEYHVKPGHRQEWMELVKLYHETLEKAVPTANWALYESYYGENNGGIYLVVSLMKSLAENDSSMGDGKKIEAALGAKGMKRVSDLTAACIEDQQTNLFEISPKMSYSSEEWGKADPFWKMKTAPAAAKKAAATNP